MPPLKIIVAGSQIPLVETAVDRAAEALADVLRHFGHRVSRLRLPLPPTLEDLPRHLAAFRLFELEHGDGEPGDLLIALDLPAATLRHPRKVVWIAHPTGGLEHAPDGPSDPFEALSPDTLESLRRAARLFLPEASGAFATSATAATSLSRLADIELRGLLSPLPEPLARARPTPADPEERPLVLLSLPEAGRLPVERILDTLALLEDRATFAVLSRPGREVPGVFQATAGARGLELGTVEETEEGPAVEELRRATGTWLCGVRDYSPWPAWRAFARYQPVLTTYDGGASAEATRSFPGGSVVEPTPESLARALDAMPTRAKVAAETTEDFLLSTYPDWHEVVDTLLREATPCAS